MRWLSRVATVVVSLLVVAIPMAQADDAVVYLHPDGADRYRPAIDSGGAVSIIANIDAITPPAMSPDGSQVAFSGAVGDESLGRFALFLVEPNGLGLTQLTDGTFGDVDPAWSPDGETIAFAQNPTGSIMSINCCRLALVDADNGEVTSLTSNIGAARPSFSSDGEFIVYDTPSGVFRMPAGGGSASLLASGGFDATTSPSDEQVAYVARAGSRYEVRRVSAGGGAPTVLYESVGVIENPSWIGDRIYFLEHTGLGYDGRKSVTYRSVHQAGGEFRIERSFGTHLVGINPGRDNDEIFFYRDDGLFRYYDISADGSLPLPIIGGDGYTTSWTSIKSIDLDGDGLDEMFFYRDDGLFRYYNIRTNGSLPLPMSAGDGYTNGWSSITALDLDGDGQDEIFFYRDDGLFRYYHIRPNGTLPLPFNAGSSYSGDWDIITAVDVEGDGQDELLFYRDNGLYRIYDINSHGTLGPPMQAGNDYGDAWSTISAIDLDGDGDDELFFYREDGTFRYNQMEPDGVLGSLIIGGTGYTSGWSTITSVALKAG